MLRVLGLVAGLCAAALPALAADLQATDHNHRTVIKLNQAPVPAEVPVPPPPAWTLWHFGYEREPPYVFLAPTYYESFAARLRLPPPPPGFEWVRRGRDLALVDPRTGYVADYRDDVLRGSPLY